MVAASVMTLKNENKTLENVHIQMGQNEILYENVLNEMQNIAQNWAHQRCQFNKKNSLLFFLNLKSHGRKKSQKNDFVVKKVMLRHTFYSKFCV